MAFGVRELRGRPWLTAGLLALALLFLPMAAWLFAPRVGGFAAPPAPRRTAAMGSAESEPESSDEADEQHAANAPRPAATKPPADEETDGVRGVVLDPDGKPVARAFVSCNGKPKGKELFDTTDADGKFKLPDDADGCRATARHPEYSPSSEARLDKGRANEIRLRSGGAIDGVVVDEHGTGVAPVLVAVESYVNTGDSEETPPASGRAKSFEARSGAFTLEKLAPGRYVLTASAEGRPPAHSGPIDVESGRTTRGAKIVLPKGGKLAGKVIDAETKKPVAGAAVSLDSVTSSQANAVKGVTTDERGAYALDGAPTGPFSIRVGHLSYRTKIVPGLTSTSGGAPTSVDVELTPRGDGGAETELGGIGVQIIPSRGAMRVAVLEPGGPAAQAGVRSLDSIVKIDGADVSALTVVECTQRLRGPAGTSVVVTVDRGGEMLDLAITRANLKIPR